MTKRATFAAAALCSGCFIAGASEAALIDRGGGLIYDDVLNVTWLQDAQYAVTSGHTAGGMSWTDAVSWTGSLQYYDSVRGVTWDDWRLPSTIDSVSSRGWDTTGLSSELAYMYYVNLGYAPDYSMHRSVPNPSSSAFNPFTNLAYLGYWSGTVSAWSNRAWATHFHFGYQGLNSVTDSVRVWAVRDGDVAGATTPSHSVPEPASLALFGVGLGLAGLMRRRRSSR